MRIEDTGIILFLNQIRQLSNSVFPVKGTLPSASQSTSAVWGCLDVISNLVLRRPVTEAVVLPPCFQFYGALDALKRSTVSIKLFVLYQIVDGILIEELGTLYASNAMFGEFARGRDLEVGRAYLECLYLLSLLLPGYTNVCEAYLETEVTPDLTSAAS